MRRKAAARILPSHKIYSNRARAALATNMPIEGYRRTRAQLLVAPSHATVRLLLEEVECGVNTAAHIRQVGGDATCCEKATAGVMTRHVAKTNSTICQEAMTLLR